MKKFGLEKALQKCTPIVTHVKLSKDEQRVFVVQSLYRSVIGTLLYLNPIFHDITFSKGVCSRYQANPTIRHLTQVKHIIKYINGTSGYGILYYFEQTSRWWAIVMLIGSGMLKIVKTHLMHVSFWETI